MQRHLITTRVSREFAPGVVQGRWLWRLRGMDRICSSIIQGYIAHAILEVLLPHLEFAPVSHAQLR